jgi:hypothetical protein
MVFSEATRSCSSSVARRRTGLFMFDGDVKRTDGGDGLVNDVVNGD